MYVQYRHTRLGYSCSTTDAGVVISQTARVMFSSDRATPEPEYGVFCQDCILSEPRDAEGWTRVLRCFAALPRWNNTSSFRPVQVLSRSRSGAKVLPTRLETGIPGTGGHPAWPGIARPSGSRQSRIELRNCLSSSPRGRRGCAADCCVWRAARTGWRACRVFCVAAGTAPR